LLLLLVLLLLLLLLLLVLLLLLLMLNVIASKRILLLIPLYLRHPLPSESCEDFDINLILAQGKLRGRKSSYLLL